MVADEAYFEYVSDPDYPDSLDDHREDRAVLTIRTFSKAYGLAGLRVGYGIAHPEIVAMMNQVREPFNVNAAAQWAATAAVDDTEHLRRSIEVNRQGLALLAEGLAALGVEWVPSQANFILVRTGQVSRVYEGLLRRGGHRTAGGPGVSRARAGDRGDPGRKPQVPGIPFAGS